MSNIYLKVTIEKKRRSQNFDFLSLRNLSPVHVLGSSNSRRYHWILTSCCNLKSRSLIANCVPLFYYFNFEQNYDILKSKSLSILLNKTINFNKNEGELKMGNPKYSFWEMNLVLQLIYESQIKSKTAMSWSSGKIKGGIFCIVYFVRWKFLFYLNV